MVFFRSLCYFLRYKFLTVSRLSGTAPHTFQAAQLLIAGLLTQSASSSHRSTQWLGFRNCLFLLQTFIRYGGKKQRNRSKNQRKMGAISGKKVSLPPPLLHKKRGKRKRGQLWTKSLKRHTRSWFRCEPGRFHPHACGGGGGVVTRTKPWRFLLQGTSPAVQGCGQAASSRPMATGLFFLKKPNRYII